MKKIVRPQEITERMEHMMMPDRSAGEMESEEVGGASSSECRTRVQQTLPLQYLEYPIGHEAEIADRAARGVG